MPSRSSLSLFTACAVALVAIAGTFPLSAQAEEAQYHFVDSGALRGFVLADDEIYVRWAAGAPADVRGAIEAGVPGTTVIEATDSRALVKLSERPEVAKLRAKTHPLNVAFPGAQVSPVLYQSGVPRDKTNRRVMTAEILAAVAAGQTPALVGAKVGAVSARMSAKAGLAILELPGAYHVLNALAVLEKAGIAANPLLGHAWKAMAVPQDRFFADQWHLLNTGQSGSVFGIDANVLDAWQVTLGANITIGIVDSCLQTGHPDLAPNTPTVNTGLHFDFLDKDTDPNPHFGDNHGTSVAGVAAAKQNNGAIDPNDGSLLGVSGSAPNARLIGLRLINESGFVPVTDTEESSALFWKPDGETPIVDISNNSWGPVTEFNGLIGPDVLTQQALKDAVELGRGGKGQITLFAAGNGRFSGSEVNLNAYANSRYVIAVGAISNLGKASFYSEPGASVLVSAPSNGGTLGIVTTDDQDVAGYNPPNPLFGAEDLSNTDYTNSFGGTSSATPLVAGVTALLLSSNPDLGWRDVKEILASTARQVDSGDPSWANNGAGFKFSNIYGGGMVDASAAVIRGTEWTNLTQELSQEVRFPANQLPLIIPDGNVVTGVNMNFNFTGPNYPNLRAETVEVTLDIEHSRRSDLIVSLISPSGTESVLAQSAVPLGDDTNYRYAVFTGTGIAKQQQGWTFTSVRNWGENSVGTWKVVVKDRFTTRLPDNNIHIGRILSANVRVYGTLSGSQRFKFENARYSALEPDNADGAPPRDLKVNVQRIGNPVGTVSVDFVTSIRGTAKAAGEGVADPDYLAVGGSILFANGETTKEITIPILHDTFPESTETIYLLLKNPAGASLGGVSLATIAVLDNDANNVLVEAPDSEATEPSEATPLDVGVFKISRTVSSAQPLTVKYSVSGTATPGLVIGTDYVPVEFTATIPANETSTTVTVTPRDDEAIEGVETVILTLNNDAAYTLGLPTSAEVRIIDNDRPDVTITVVSNNVLRENDPTRVATVRLSRTDDNTLPLIVNLNYGGNQVNGGQYEDADNGGALPDQVVFLPGQSTLDLHIRPVNDAVYQASKEIVISLHPSQDYTFNFGFLSSISLTVLEDDPLPDAKIPALKVTAPKLDTRFVSPAPVTVTGTASDNFQVAAVEYRINSGSWKAVPNVVAGASVNWTLPLNLPDHPTAPEIAYGNNVVELRSIDNDSNRSLTGVARFKYVIEQPLTVNISGQGSVTTGFAGQTTRELGTTYTITAKPGAGQVFYAWRGLRANVGNATITGGDATTSEVQQIDVSAVTGAGGSFVLTFGGQTTAEILMPANAATVQTRLNALTAISAVGGVAVTTGPAAALFNVTFTQVGDQSEITGTGLKTLSSRTISFTLADLAGGELKAEFIASPFGPTIAGNYSGLARETFFAFESSGYVTLKINSLGAFTGKLLLGPASYVLKGEFSGAGVFVGTISRKNDLPLNVNLTIDLNAAGTQRVTGTIKSPTFTLATQADRAPFSRTSPPPASVANKVFTLVLPPNDLSHPTDPPSEFDPKGNGYGTAKIDAAGTVKATGVLGDGTKFSVTQALTKDLTWPFFAQPYAKKGVVIGLITHDPTQLDSDLSGIIDWFKPSLPKDKYFPLGFKIDGGDLLGSLYTFQGGQALPGFASAADNALITLIEGNLVNPILKFATFDSSNVVTINEQTSPSKGEGLTFKINAKAGTFTGTFIHSISLKRTTVNGVLFQKQERAVGAFLGTSVEGVPLQTGKVTMEPRP